MGTNLLDAGAAWLQEKQQESASVQGTFRRGGQAAVLAAILGSPVEVPYGGSQFPTVAHTAYVARADLTFDGVTLIAPAVDDSLEWTTPDYVLRILTLGPWGPDRAPAKLEDDGIMWRLFGRETAGIQLGLAARKTTLADLEKPKASPTRNSYGEIARGQYDVAAANVYVELQPEAAGEQTDADKLAQVSKFRAFINTTQAVTASWRLKVKSGPWTGRYLSLESVTPVPGFANELMLIGRMVVA